MFTRRHFMQVSGGAFLLAATKTARAGIEYDLTAAPATASLLEDPALQTGIWAYNGICPGPVLRAKKGEEITVNFTNRLEQATTIHWHGIRIDNAMDGVAMLTQEPVPPGGSFTYRFTPPDAGTFWYHPHHLSWEQVDRGLYGALIVDGDEEADSFDHDHVIVADDWRLSEDGAFHEASLGNMMDWSHAGRLGNYMTLNGKAYERFSAGAGSRIRLRIINSANARVLRFGIEKHRPWLIALDGQPITPVRLDDKGIRLSPAQRADLAIDLEGKPGDEFAIAEMSSGENLVVGYLVCEQGGSATRDPDQPPRLQKHNIPTPEGELLEAELLMEGGAMRFLQSATYEGKELDGRTLAMEHQQMWAFNGVAGMEMHHPMFTAPRGQSIRMKIINQTLWPHAIHVHGHHFHVLSRRTEAGSDGLLNEDLGPRDTVLLDRDEIVEIGFVADNPGKWMIHCHMLEHQAAGMGTWFEVS